MSPSSGGVIPPGDPSNPSNPELYDAMCTCGWTESGLVVLPSFCDLDDGSGKHSLTFRPSTSGQS